MLMYMCSILVNTQDPIILIVHYWTYSSLLSWSLSVGVVPGPPTDLAVTEATKSYVVLSWKPPVQRGHEGIMYFIEKVRKEKKHIQFSYEKCY